MQLTFEEARVIGVLVEKKITTPDYYPMTINAITNACNQKSNRHPVVSYDEGTVESTIESLREKRLAVRQTGADIRVPKYREAFSEALNFSPQETAVITVLMLRGAQTIGEIKGRSGRMYDFRSLQEVEDVLNRFESLETPLVKKLPRRPGMKESRYAHLLSGEPEIIQDEEQNDSAETTKSLEDEIERVKAEMEKLKAEFENFRKQFE